LKRDSLRATVRGFFGSSNRSLMIGVALSLQRVNRDTGVSTVYEGYRQDAGGLTCNLQGNEIASLRGQ
jgi:hypothetical protein